MKEYTPVKEGKVREIYDLGNELVMVATDRISAFDVILKNKITKKGTVLTQMSKFWFDYTKDILPNHMISVDPEDMPEFFRGEDYCGNSMLVKKLTMLPIECIVRGYLSGSGWKAYQQTGEVCGHRLPEGLRESDKIEPAIFTPSTKAELGSHDENISVERAAELIGPDAARQVEQTALAIYEKGRAYAAERGIIVADTKFEFGFVDGKIHLIDEVLTPDSSRFWAADKYEPGHGQPSFDKQYLRDWLKRQPWNMQPPPPVLPDEVADVTAGKYRDAYRILTGSELKI